jgi:two-component system chemotaxis response regulator CheY
MKTLIVEDDFISRLLMQDFLKGYGQCHIAVNGKEAVEAARVALDTGEPYDLICMDIMMPEMNGQQALKLIRANEEAAAVDTSRWSKIVMTTALQDHQNVSGACQGLCDAYLIKPIDRAKFLDELRKLGLIS